MPQARTQTPFSAKLKNSPPKKLKNEAYRTREFLTEQEINQLRAAARRHGRHGHRDDTLILMMFRPLIHYEVFSSGPCGSCSGTTANSIRICQ